MYGEHTYFLDSNGLNIVEPAAAELAPNTSGMGVVVNLANWTNSNPPKLEAHEPEPTESMVALGDRRRRIGRALTVVVGLISAIHAEPKLRSLVPRKRGRTRATLRWRTCAPPAARAVGCVRRHAEALAWFAGCAGNQRPSAVAL